MIYKSHDVVQSGQRVSGFIGQCPTLAVVWSGSLKKEESGLRVWFHTRIHCVPPNCLLFGRSWRLTSPSGSFLRGQGQCTLTPECNGAGERCVGSDFSNTLNDTASVSFEARITVTSYKKSSWISQPERIITSTVLLYPPHFCWYPNI